MHSLRRTLLQNNAFMKRILTIILAVMTGLMPAITSRAQGGVVIDPTHIGVAIENTASSLSEMITMIEEMFSLNDKLDDIYGLAEKVEEVADRFREVGYLVEMTESYNELLKRTIDYSTMIRKWAAEDGIYGYEKELRYLYRCEKQGIKLFEMYINYFRSLKTSDADKAQEAKNTYREIKREIDKMDKIMMNIEDTKVISGSITSTLRYLDKANSIKSYTDTYAHLGSADRAAGAWISLMQTLELIILGIMALMVVIIVFRGADVGMTTSSSAPVRWFIGGGIAFLVLQIMEIIIR